MKTRILFSTFLLFILFFSTQEMQAQWVQEDSPPGGWVFLIDNNNDYCYASVSGSIFRSGDDGDNWEEMPIAFDSGGGRITANENKLTALIYHDPEKNLFISEDNGDSWEEVSLLDTMSSVSHAISTAHGVYAASFNDIWVTHDMGQTWEYAAGNDEVPYIQSIEVFNDEIYFGGLNKIVRIEENGVDWEILNIPIGNQNVTSIFVDGDIILAKGSQGYYRSSDGGSNWEELDGDWGTNIRNFVEIDDNYYALSGLEVMKSENQGQDWNIITAFSSDTTMVYLGKSGNNLLLGSYFKGIYKSSDNGLSWVTSNKGINKAQVNDIIQVGNAQIANVYGGLFKKWNVNTPWGTTNLFAAPNSISSIAHSAEDIFIAGGSALVGTVLKSSDFGNSWNDVTPENMWGLGTFSQVHVDGDVLYAWDEEIFLSDLMKSEDGGSTWTNIEANLYSQLGFNAFRVSIDDGVIYVLLGSNTNNLAKSIDEGETWTLIESNIGLEDMFFKDLEIKNGVLFAEVSGDTHLYISHDGGENFFAASEELSSTSTSNPVFYCVESLDENIFIISTTGGGLHITYDKGINWVPFDEGIEEKVTVKTIFVGDTYLLVGTTNKGIWKRSIGDIDGVNFFSGHVYEDDNNDGVEDNDEQGFSNALLELGSDRYSTTDTNGDYTFYTFGDIGDTVKAIKPVLYSEVSPAYHILSTYDSLYTFGINIQPDISDLRVTITGLTAPRPGFDHKYRITYKNVGTVTLDGQISFDFDEILTYLGASPAPDEVVVPNLKWDYLALAPEEIRNIMVSFNIPDTTSIDAILSSLVEITPIDGDEQTSDNFHPIREEVVGSYDPNDKSVEPKDEFTTEQLEDGQKLVYTIRFQNTGNYPAEFVRITDQLQSTLDVTTFEVLSASHPYTYTIKGTGMVEFFFDNIQLPDSTSNEVDSHGFIKFAIAAKSYLPIGLTIKNFADIYFDYNTPIRTNTAETTITTPTFIRQLIEAPMPVKVFPNPSSGLFTLAFEAPSNDNTDYFIVDNVGRSVKAGTFIQTSKVELDVTTLDTGLYYILMKSKEKNYIGKILIQK